MTADAYQETVRLLDKAAAALRRNLGCDAALARFWLSLARQVWRGDPYRGQSE